MHLFESLPTGLGLPDLWQIEAKGELDAGRDVVVHAPTGAGKTRVFELLVERGWRGRAVFTVPTRALANDKLAEWRARGWNVGIATGDVAENLDAPVVVATLETQRNRLLRREGPDLLVVDEYQLLGDAARGVTYELAVALAPATTRLLLLSGSVRNPDDVVAWLRRLGREAVLVRHDRRPTPLEEIHLEALAERVPEAVRGFWPRLIARALMANLGPVLVFAPRRRAAEQLARQVAAALPAPEPLALSPEQRRLAGDDLARLLAARVAHHHSGLGYAQRAGLVEPLAKAGQLRVVVATTGLAAGINFSMRSVLVTEREFTADNTPRSIRPDELLQMFGRAGRRGLDEVGYVLVAPDRPRLGDGRTLSLRRTDAVEWPGLLAAMHAAASDGRDPCRAAVELGSRLFSAQTVPLGLEESLASGPMACGIAIDGQRVRHARSTVVRMRGFSGAWEPRPAEETVPLAEAWTRVDGGWRPALAVADVAGRFGRGRLCLLLRGKERRYGREAPLAQAARGEPGSVVLLKGVRRALAAAGTSRVDGRPLHAPMTEARLRALIPPLVAGLSGGGALAEIVERGGILVARIDLGALRVPAFRDASGRALMDPEFLESGPAECASCERLPVCTTTGRVRGGPALAWFRLGLIDAGGRPTRRGVVFGFFHNGEGLAVAAALEDPGYDIDALVVDLANLRAGHRFADHAGASGRLAIACRTLYGESDYEGCLFRGVPVNYGDGAAEVLSGNVPRRARHGGLSPELRTGDIERARLEWRSLLRHVVHAPDLPWERWRSLKKAAARLVQEASSRRAITAAPALSPDQRRRVDHRLRFR